MDPRDDYADRGLPPERRPTRIGVILVLLAAIALILSGLPLVARLVVAKMEWTF
jgi:hypothetical protein